MTDLLRACPPPPPQPVHGPSHHRGGQGRRTQVSRKDVGRGGGHERPATGAFDGAFDAAAHTAVDTLVPWPQLDEHGDHSEYLQAKEGLLSLLTTLLLPLSFRLST